MQRGDTLDLLGPGRARRLRGQWVPGLHSLRSLARDDEGGRSRRDDDVGAFPYIPHRNAAVWTGASQNFSISASSMVSVIEQPAMSREVT